MVQGFEGREVFVGWGLEYVVELVEEGTRFVEEPLLVGCLVAGLEQPEVAFEEQTDNFEGVTGA